MSALQSEPSNTQDALSEVLRWIAGPSEGKFYVAVALSNTSTYIAGPTLDVEQHKLLHRWTYAGR